MKVVVTVGCAAHIGTKGYACIVLVITPERRRPLVRRRYRQEGNVGIHIEEIELESVDLLA
jgi:peptide subunit release factor 1 (eRF1)